MSDRQMIQRFVEECLAIRQVLQDTQGLTPADRASLRSQLEELLESLEAKVRRGEGQS